MCARLAYAQVGVPRASYELCLEKKELIALLLVRPPLARSLLGIMCVPQRRSQFGAVLDQLGGNKTVLLEFWLSVQSYRQMAVATIGDAATMLPSPLCSIPSVLRAAKDIHREWFQVRCIRLHCHRQWARACSYLTHSCLLSPHGQTAAENAGWLDWYDRTVNGLATTTAVPLPPACMRETAACLLQVRFRSPATLARLAVVSPRKPFPLPNSSRNVA